MLTPLILVPLIQFPRSTCIGLFSTLLSSWSDCRKVMLDVDMMRCFVVPEMRHLKLNKEGKYGLQKMPPLGSINVRI